MSAFFQGRKGTAAAVSRSLRVYHGHPDRARAMDLLYGQFVRSGDLVFDVGAHVGDRISSFRRLGARVVALEPQPGPLRALQLIHGRDSEVALVKAAAGAAEGAVTFLINSANPTVSTASEAFIHAADGAAGWEGQAWDARITVPCTTMDALIAEHGVPRFIKIDVEGFEDAVLAGLTQAVPALSFEFTTIQKDVAFACLQRLAQTGAYRFTYALGESQDLVFSDPVDAARMMDTLEQLPHEANSGDVYAILT